ncbi:MAG: hypothetical protein ACJAVX_003501, partial [Pseudoalteromonas rhizosphaerae]
SAITAAEQVNNEPSAMVLISERFMIIFLFNLSRVMSPLLPTTEL